MNNIKRPIPKLYDFLYNKKAVLNSAFSIQDYKEFNGIYTLSFRYPKFLLDSNGNNKYDDDGKPIYDKKADLLLNELLIEFNDNWYIIKEVRDERDNNGGQFVRVDCRQKSEELSFKQVPYLILSPPIHLPVSAEQAINHICTYPYQINYGNVVSATINTVVLNTTSTENFTGYKINIVEGTGELQQRKIISYNTSTKTATVNSNWTTTPNSTSYYRVHNSNYKLGTVSPELLNDGVNDIFRSLKFEDTTILESLNTCSTIYNGNITFDVVYDSVNLEFITAVNLKVEDAYNNVEFRYSKNLQSVSRIIDSTNSCYTRVYPEGRNNVTIHDIPTRTRIDNGVLYDEHTQGRGDIYNFQYYLALGYTLDQCKKLFVKDFLFQNDAYTDDDMLYEGAKKELEKLSLPKITYTINGIDLSVLGYSYLDFNVGDRIKVVDTHLGIDVIATVVIKDVNWDNPHSPRIELSNFIDTMGDLFLKILKYNEAFSKRKGLYGKSTTVVIADEVTSRNWRYADYVVPRDGSMSADEVLNKAIVEVSENGGGLVTILDGKYGLKNTSLKMKPNVDLKGNGFGTIIYPKSSSITNAIEYDSVQNSVVSDLYFDYNRAFDGITKLNSFTTIAKNTSPCKNIKLDNIKVDFLDGYMIEFELCDNLSLINFTGEQTLYTPSDSILAKLTGCTNATIDGTYLFGKYTGICEIYSNTSTGKISDSDTVITNSTFQSDIMTLTDIAIFVDVTLSSSININRNSIINTTGGGSAIVFSNGANARIDNNTIYGDFRNGILVTGSLYDSNITNNNIRITFPSGLTSAGISINFSGTNIIQNNTIKRGSFYGTLPYALDYGLRLLGGGNNIVSNNDFNSSGTISSFQDLAVSTSTLGGNKL